MALQLLKIPVFFAIVSFGLEERTPNLFASVVRIYA